jgi:orotidine-5'-phosphate decarboxylase
MKFKEKLEKIINKNNSIISVGLDIDKQKMPNFLFKDEKDPYSSFITSIIDATKDTVCAYKINIAFYEYLGKTGFELLERIMKYIPNEIIVILDGKRNDIGNTARMYASSLFEYYKADAVTINPYLGYDGVKPFLEYKDKCSFILCRTSNKSAGDFQDLKSENVPLYQIVANKIKDWNLNNNCGAVVGATYIEELKTIREILGDEIPLLIPGIGKQGGDIEKTAKFGTNKDGMMAIINSSRGIIYAGKDKDYLDDVREATLFLNNIINRYR